MRYGIALDIGTSGLRCQALDLRMKSAYGADSAAELKEFLMELAQEAAG